jgi:hypothetical protein
MSKSLWINEFEKKISSKIFLLKKSQLLGLEVLKVFVSSFSFSFLTFEFFKYIICVLDIRKRNFGF